MISDGKPTVAEWHSQPLYSSAGKVCTLPNRANPEFAATTSVLNMQLSLHNCMKMSPCGAFLHVRLAD